jgi:hypothetical protein
VRGLVSSLLGSASSTLGGIAESNFKRKQETEFQKEIMRMQEEKDLRVDETRRSRDIEGIKRIATATVEAEQATLPARLEMGRQKTEYEAGTAGLVAEQLGGAERVQREAAQTSWESAEEQRRSDRADQEKQMFEVEIDVAKTNRDRDAIINELIDQLADFSGSPAARANLENRLAILSGRPSGTKEDPMDMIRAGTSAMTAARAAMDAGDFDGAQQLIELGTELLGAGSNKLFGRSSGVPSEAVAELFSGVGTWEQFESTFEGEIPAGLKEAYQELQQARQPAPTQEPVAAPAITGLVAPQMPEPGTPPSNRRTPGRSGVTQEESLARRIRNLESEIQSAENRVATLQSSTQRAGSVNRPGRIQEEQALIARLKQELAELTGN